MMYVLENANSGNMYNELKNNATDPVGYPKAISFQKEEDALAAKAIIEGSKEDKGIISIKPYECDYSELTSSSKFFLCAVGGMRAETRPMASLDEFFSSSDIKAYNTTPEYAPAHSFVAEFYEKSRWRSFLRSEIADVSDRMQANIDELKRAQLEYDIQKAAAINPDITSDIELIKNMLDVPEDKMPNIKAHAVSDAYGMDLWYRGGLIAAKVVAEKLNERPMTADEKRVFSEIYSGQYEISPATIENFLAKNSTYYAETPKVRSFTMQLQKFVEHATQSITDAGTEKTSSLHDKINNFNAERDAKTTAETPFQAPSFSKDR